MQHFVHHTHKLNSLSSLDIMVKIELLKAFYQKKHELVLFKDNELELEVSVNPKEDTVWLTQE